MPLSLNIPPDTEARLREKAEENGQNLAAFLMTLAEEDAWEKAGLSGLDPQTDWEETVAAVSQALADFDAGDRGMLLEDYIAEVRAKRLTRAKL